MRGTALPLARLLADAIDYAQNGTPVTASQASATASKFDELKDLPGFAETWLIDGKPPRVGSRFYQPAMAATLKRLADDGLDSFYRGPLAECLRGWRNLACPSLADLNAHVARRTTPLKLPSSRVRSGIWPRRRRGWCRWRYSGSPTASEWPMPTKPPPFTASSKPPSWPLGCAIRITDPRELKTDIQRLLAPRRWTRLPTG
jgi:gamma-glutamyltranspeptidase/glutathione hydrolase